jgi:hypothetical protein
MCVLPSADGSTASSEAVEGLTVRVLCAKWLPVSGAAFGGRRR